MPRYFLSIKFSFLLISPPNVEVNRSKEGAAPAPQETCLTQESVPTIGSALTWVSSYFRLKDEKSYANHCGDGYEYTNCSRYAWTGLRGDRAGIEAYRPTYRQ